MDLNTVRSVRIPRSRAELALGRGEVFLGGGSWLFSEPQIAATGLVDLLALGWPPFERDEHRLRIAATCTLAQLAAVPAESGWNAHPLFRQCCAALLGSFKVWNVATVGGNICLALPAGPMTSLAVALGATLVIWTPDGGEKRHDAADFVTGVGRTLLQPGEVLRAVDFPTRALRARTASRRISLRPVGRSAALVIGRLDPDGAFALTVTAATERPYRFAFERIPSIAELDGALDSIDRWYDDPHGGREWRQAMTRRLSGEVLAELAQRVETA